ncbi:hypothetical protein [Kocuria sp. CPCC 205263]|uniref:hypothetical protein n=1 Tax=Kocuria sp. CPCC 205263 TaxID=3073555 RepID=UPI0034D5D372
MTNIEQLHQHIGRRVHVEAGVYKPTGTLEAVQAQTFDVGVWGGPPVTKTSGWLVRIDGKDYEVGTSPEVIKILD